MLSQFYRVASPILPMSVCPECKLIVLAVCRKGITSLKGMRVATSLKGSFGDEVSKRVGFVPIGIAFAEIEPALEKGVIDCVLRTAGRP